MITVHFYEQDQNGLVALEVNDRITIRREPSQRYREIGHVKIDYRRRPPTDHPDDDDRDALCCALEYMRAFKVEAFLDWVVQNLAAAGLNHIANTIAGLLRNEYKKARVILFDLEALDSP